MSPPLRAYVVDLTGEFLSTGQPIACGMIVNVLAMSSHVARNYASNHYLQTSPIKIVTARTRIAELTDFDLDSEWNLVNKDGERIARLDVVLNREDLGDDPTVIQ